MRQQIDKKQRNATSYGFGEVKALGQRADIATQLKNAALKDSVNK